MAEITKEIDLNDLDEIVQDMKGIDALLVHLESSEYFRGSEEDSLTFRAIRNSLENTKNKLVYIMGDYYKEKEE